MNTEAMGGLSLTTPRASEPGQEIDRRRQSQQQGQTTSDAQDSKTPPEEILNHIKALTDDGMYSVRFERDSSSNELIVKIVNSETDEVIRQIPPEAMVNLRNSLTELSGNLVDTKS